MSAAARVPSLGEPGLLPAGGDRRCPDPAAVPALPPPRRRALQLGMGALALTACPAILAQAPTVLRCPRIDNDIDQICTDMLRLALKYAPGVYQLQPWPVRVERSRALYELGRGQYLDVAWAVTSRARESALLPVRIPLDRGLSGWRIALVARANAQRFAAVRQLTDLAGFKAGLGLDWVETEVLRANGLPVVAGSNTASLASMLAVGRFDYYPRPLRQAWVEADQYARLGLVVEPYVALHFPSALYFFVNNANAALAAVLEQGLRAAIADGAFERLFQQQNSPYLQRAALAQRRILRLDNPALTEQTLQALRALWYLPPL
ncbi:MAG: hypothetical protein K2X55_08045 [Burkholderiaceae bacterium]|nr:hypothetical protein [Burkholderiaceae bacterium]